MEKEKIVIAGGTGFIGKYLQKQFLDSGCEVIIISRKPTHIQWNDLNKLITALNNAVMLINLAGKSVDCRYNKKNKQEILFSRTGTTRILGEVILQCKNPPSVWINSGTATIYRHAEDRPMTEKHGEIGQGFSVNVATAWERAFFDFKLPQTRQIVLRTAIVLGQGGGAVKPLINLVRLGLGGKQGNGKQIFSWIHIEDVFAIITFLKSQRMISGVINASAPYPVTNNNLMKQLRYNMHIKIGLSMPAWLLKIGAVMIKTETELILKSRWVLPARLIDAGYQFKYPTLDLALKNVLERI